MIKVIQKDLKNSKTMVIINNNIDSSSKRMRRNITGIHCTSMKKK